MDPSSSMFAAGEIKKKMRLFFSGHPVKNLKLLELLKLLECRDPLELSKTYLKLLKDLKLF